MFLDLTGHRFGNLIVKAPTSRRRGKTVIWMCGCDCGATTRVSTSDLKNGHTKSCGCRKHGIRRDLFGQRFGRLLVVGGGEIRNKRTYWKCLCDCGSMVETRTDPLISGITQSCGCRQKEHASVAAKRLMTTHGLSKTKEYRREKARRRQVALSGVHRINALAISNQMTELGNHCVYCGGPYEHIDHFYPLSKGGQHSLANLVPSCKKCNQSKSAKIPGKEWWPELWQPQGAFV